LLTSLIYTGGVEKLAGKAMKDPERVEKGQQRQVCVIASFVY
jgi:hypothetical protein